MKLKITVHGVSYEVEVEMLDPGEGFQLAAPSPLPRVQPVAAPAGQIKPVQPAPVPQTTASSPGGTVNSPIAGTILEIKCKAGDTVEKNQVLLVIEAMKMETSIAAPVAGRIKAIDVAVGDAVREGQILVKFE